MYLMHSEAKQTKSSKFGAGKDLLQRPSKENWWLVLKRPELLDDFCGRVFIVKIWGEAYRMCDFCW